MPRATHEEDVTYGSNPFRRLKSKGESITFRIVGKPFYDGQHWSQDEDGDWESTECPRIMRKEECQLCQQAMELRRQAKAEKDKEKKKELDKKVREKSVRINWYYPIIDRDTHAAAILQTTIGVRNKLRQEFDNEINILEYDYVLTRTEKPGSDYYSLVRKDSKECKPLTKEEKGEIEHANQLLEDLVVSRGNKETEEEVDVEKVAKEMEEEESEDSMAL